MEGPPSGGKLRAWLATVATNAAQKQGREQARRERRERAGGPGAPSPAPPEVVHRARLHQGVVKAVLELDEPYRSTLLHRYFDELSPAAIATRQGVPIETVRTRLRRAREELRGRLRRRSGSEVEWLEAMAPLAFGRAIGGAGAPTAPASGAGTVAASSAAGSPLVLGALLMSMPVKLSLAVLVLGTAVGGWWWLREDPDPASGERLAPVEVAIAAGEAAPTVARDDPVLAEVAIERTIEAGLVVIVQERTSGAPVSAYNLSAFQIPLDPDRRIAKGFIGGRE